jgi:dihydropteroate synthase
MGVLNVTPDSFSDGGRFFSVDAALRRAEEMINEGADILDVGGESTRPAAGRELVSADEETRRVAPVIEAVARRCSAPISVDTTKPAVARAALEAGAEIVNDISGLRFAPELADVAARAGAGLVLMHSRGAFAEMHALAPVPDIWDELHEGLSRSIETATQRGVSHQSIILDPGVGFGKSPAQNVELAARPDRMQALFPDFPLLYGTSRKSFIGRILGDAPPDARLHGTMATVAVAVLRGAHVVRVHDVKAAVETVRVAEALRTGGG